MSHFADDDTLALIESLKQQLEEARQQCVYESGLSASRTIELTEAKKQNVLLWTTLDNAAQIITFEGVPHYLLGVEDRDEALAATQDLSGCIICDAEPILLFRRKGMGKDYCTCDEERFNKLNQMPRQFETTKLYRPKELK